MQLDIPEVLKLWCARPGGAVVPVWGGAVMFVRHTFFLNELWAQE
jgi:hypothetical protein